jgi:hypothetical protein
LIPSVRFDVTSVLNPDLSLNDEAWQEARPLLLTPFLYVWSLVQPQFFMATVTIPR